MKLYAQHGAQAGDKVLEGLQRSLIDGVIYSPRDVSVQNLKGKLLSLRNEFPASERLFDPQLYAAFFGEAGDARLGFLLEDYGAYFKPRRRRQLEKEIQVRADLLATLRFQQDLPVTALIAPNILIPRSFDSIEALVAKNFIRFAAGEHARLGDPRPVFATLAMSRDAIRDKTELIEFLNEITVLDEPPQGFYILVAARNADARTDIYNADVIAAWMLINHTLKLNGFEVVNGFSDIVTPFLGAAGGFAGGLGWWSNLRTFSMDRFAPSGGGGRLPIQRYLSVRLFNRITFFELDALRDLMPFIVNNLTTDVFYDPNLGSEPQRNVEVLQSWEAVKELNSRLVLDEQAASLAACSKSLLTAQSDYETLPIILDSKSNAEHLDPLLEGLALFKELAEL
jgi:hypothetical protein